jgi:hypothetical protein
VGVRGANGRGEVICSLNSRCVRGNYY